MDQLKNLSLLSVSSSTSGLAKQSLQARDSRILKSYIAQEQEIEYQVIRSFQIDMVEDLKDTADASSINKQQAKNIW